MDDQVLCTNLTITSSYGLIWSSSFCRRLKYENWTDKGRALVVEMHNVFGKVSLLHRSL